MLEPHRWGDHRNIKIGLLGGSFNPAHAGHLHISADAQRRLGLDQVWWLVSPQNPLKPTEGMAALADRTAGAREVATVPWIKVTELEQTLNVDRTWGTLEVLGTRFPKARFVWLMGADNLAQIHRWTRWQEIFQMVHVAVFDRSPYSHKALSGKASWRFASRRLRASRPMALWQKKKPSWVYVAQRRHGASSTAIRSGCDGDTT